MPDDPGLVWKAVSAAGLLFLIGAYLVNQTGRCSPESARYLLANAVGAGTLAAYSVRIDEPIFVGLEGFWCLASVFALFRTRPPATPRAVDGPATGSGAHW